MWRLNCSPRVSTAALEVAAFASVLWNGSDFGRVHAVWDGDGEGRELPEGVDLDHICQSQALT